MDNKELGNKYIRLGKLIRNDKAKLSDLVAAALDCGLIFSVNLSPLPEESVDIVVGEEEPQMACCPK